MSEKPAPKTFAVVATVEDPLSADRLVEVLTGNELDAFHRGRAGASSDTFGAISQGYWEVLVQAESLAIAENLVREEMEAIAKDEAANAQAADDEHMSKENPVE